MFQSVAIPVGAAFVSAFAVVFFGRAFGWFSKHRMDDSNEELLIHGRPAAPGVPEVKPLGDRLSTLEQSMKGVTTTVTGQTAILKSHGSMLRQIVDELGHGTNGHKTFRDTVEEAAGDARTNAGNAAQAATRAALIDQKLAEHFEVELDPET